MRYATRFTSWSYVMIALSASSACGHGKSPSAEEDASKSWSAEEDAGRSMCGQLRDAGGRSVPYCCDRPSEMPGASCVDLTEEGGAYGIYGHCIAEGESFEGKILAALCCDGLVIRSATVEDSTLAVPGTAHGCAPDFQHYSPSEVLCLACGNQRCETHENRCNCPEDCADAGTSDARL